MNKHTLGHPNMFNGRLTDLDIATALAFASDFLREQVALPSALVPIGIANGRILAEPVPIPNLTDVDGDRTVLRSILSHVCPSAAVQCEELEHTWNQAFEQDKVLDADTLLTPPKIGLLAAMGQSEVWVRRKMPVAVLSVGPDLIDAEAKPQTGQIQDAVRPMLMSALTSPWVSANDRGIVAEDQSLLRLVLQEAAAKNRIILTSGIRDDEDASTLKKNIIDQGGVILVNSVTVAPGQSAFLATLGSALVLALPSDPLGAWNIFTAMGQRILRSAANISPASTGWQAEEPSAPRLIGGAYPLAAAE